MKEQKVTTAKEMIIRKGCLQTSLSADGNRLACLQTNMDLVMFDVASGQPVIQRKEFFVPTYGNMWALYAALAQNRFDNADANFHWLSMGFSPDARYFIVGYLGRDSIKRNTQFETIEAFDLTTNSKISVGDSVKKLVVGGFSFIGSDRLAGVNYQDYKKSSVVSFPEGKVLSEFAVRGNIEAPTLGNYLLVRPIKDYPLGVLDLNTKTIFKSNKQPALDIYGDLFVAEMRNGELGLYRMEKNQIIAT